MSNKELVSVCLIAGIILVIAGILEFSSHYGVLAIVAGGVILFFGFVALIALLYKERKI